MRNKLLFISKVLLLLLFVSYYGEVTSFAHTHFSKQYGTITHSHPFTAGHTHAQKQYEVIFSLSNFLSSSFESFVLACASMLIGLLYLVRDYALPRLIHSFHFLRAPPFFA